MSDRNQIVCFGSPMMDFIIHIENETVLRTHQLRDDFHHTIDDSNRRLFDADALERDATACTVGGSVTNTVRVLKWLGDARLDVVYVGAIGVDKQGEIIERKLIDEGVKCSFRKLVDAATARCVVYVNGAQRTIVTDLGASKLYTLKNLHESNLSSELSNAKYIYFSGLFFGVSPDCIDCLLNLCIKEEKALIYNLGAAFLPKKYPQIDKVFLQAKIVFGNISEYEALNDIFQLNTTNFHKYLLELNNLGRTDRLVIVTNGESQVTIIQNNIIRNFDVQAVPKEQIADTNGAGDAFVGGFLAQLMAGRDIDACMACALWAAREIVQCVGCEFNRTKSFN